MTTGVSPWRALAYTLVHRCKRPYEVETRTREGSDNLAREGRESPSFMAGRMSMFNIDILDGNILIQTKLTISLSD
jgi:hypothetical protein